MSMRLEQRMTPELITITEQELEVIREEISTKIFNKSQEEKLYRKYQKYLWNAEEQAKKGILHEDEAMYLTSILFYHFPQEQLKLPFEEESKRFYEAIEKGYGKRPEIQIGFTGENTGFRGKTSPLLKEEIREEHLGMNISERIQGHISKAANDALLFLEQEENLFKPNFIMNAYGMIYITPLYFNERINNKHDDRFKKNHREIELKVSRLE